MRTHETHTLAFVGSFSASEIKSTGELLNTADHGLVSITRRKQRYVVVSEERLTDMLAEAADPRPKTIDDLLANFNAEQTRHDLAGWLNMEPVGAEAGAREPA